MPTIYDEKGSGAMDKGSLVHKILEEAVNRKIKTKADLFKIKDEFIGKPEFKNANHEGIDESLEVFWARNSPGFSNNLFNEFDFNFQLNGFNFNGKIDRIDKVEGKDIHIIDYKTGGAPTNEKMFLQLGMYALAVNSDERLKKYNPKLLSLQLLEEEKDKTYEVIGDELIMKGGRTKPKLSDIKKEIMNLAEGIKKDFSEGFKRIKDERECDKCEYRFYCK
jgi:DNA helicase-2/ATP-dependent DNA helicase PcrA